MAGEALALYLPPQAFDALVARVTAEVLDALGEQLAAGEQSPWMTTKEAAAYLGIPYGTFKGQAAAREWPCVEEGKRLYFDRRELDDARRRRAAGPTIVRNRRAA